MFDPSARREIQDRLRILRPDSPRRWGRMDAPRMVAHLCDQMRHTLGDTACRPQRSWLRLPLLRHAAIYLLPWPRGRIQGPPDAFSTAPAEWESDVEALDALLERFAARDPHGDWPPHALFGAMSGRDWGVFCYRHFDHHLRQFGS